MIPSIFAERYAALRSGRPPRSSGRTTWWCISIAFVTYPLMSYLIELVRCTREGRPIELGAGPRASLVLLRAAQVVAASQGRDFVTPDDVKPLAPAVLRHRLMLHADAPLQGITADERIHEVLKAVPMPRAS